MDTTLIITAYLVTVACAAWLIIRHDRKVSAITMGDLGKIMILAVAWPFFLFLYAFVMGCITIGDKMDADDYGRAIIIPKKEPK